VPALELGRPRELGELVTLSVALFVRHFSLFFTLALIVVAPYVLVVDGVWGRQLADGADANVPAATATALALSALVAGPLITAMMARTVVALDQGRVPSLGEALRAGLGVFLPAAAVVAMYTLGVIGWAALLLLPGVYFAVRWYFAAQAVVIDGRRGVAALRRSGELVSGQWWSTLGRLITLAAIGLVAGLVVGGILQAIGNGVGSPALYVVGNVLGQAAGASFGALASTLLFFDRRART
jgi:hypothetical protein